MERTDVLLGGIVGSVFVPSWLSLLQSLQGAVWPITAWLCSCKMFGPRTYPLEFLSAFPSEWYEVASIVFPKNLFALALKGCNKNNAVASFTGTSMLHLLEMLGQLAQKIRNQHQSCS